MDARLLFVPKYCHNTLSLVAQNLLFIISASLANPSFYDADDIVYDKYLLNCIST